MQQTQDLRVIGTKRLQSPRALELAQDTLGESWQQLAITIGTQAIPAMTGVVDEFNNTTRAIEIMKEQGLNPLTEMLTNGDGYINALKQANDETMAQREAMLQNKDATEQTTASVKEQEEATKAMNEANSQFLGVLGNVKQVSLALFALLFCTVI